MTRNAKKNNEDSLHKKTLIIQKLEDPLMYVMYLLFVLRSTTIKYL
jgi:hypothetical protein